MFSERDKDILDKVNRLENAKYQYEKLIQAVKVDTQKLIEVRDDIEKIIKEKTVGFPWLADAMAQYMELRDLNVAQYLNEKLRPATSAAEKVKEMARERRVAEKKFRIARNFVKYYETLFPWLEDYVDEDIDDVIKEIFRKKEAGSGDIEEDPVARYMTGAQYESLSVTERNQLALDRYWSKRKSNWELGRDYERYVGYLYEKDGFKVKYHGIEEGFEDLGRDLIAQKTSKDVRIVQCKYWSQHKTIHEKHVAQLFGTTIKYCIENKENGNRNWFDLIADKSVKPVFVTSTKLSDVAKNFSKDLGVEVRELIPLVKYPSIKCHISTRTKERIYHLPMDQQYDRTILEENSEECWVETVAEAEKAGFRRAWRWKGTTAQNV